MKKLSLISLIVFALCNIVRAQDVLWEKSYGGNYAEYLFDAQATADYGFVLAGSSVSRKSGNKEGDYVYGLDYWIWKMDERGEQEWQLSLGGSGNDFLTSLCRTREGGFLLAGYSDSPKGHGKTVGHFGMEDVWLVKLRADGSEAWQRVLGGSGKDIVKQVIQTKDGGFLIGGASTSSASTPLSDQEFENGYLKASPHYGHLDFWLVKLDAQGSMVWEHSYGGKYHDEIEDLLETEDGSIIVGGYSNSPASSGPTPKGALNGMKTEDPLGEGGDYWVLKLDGSGSIIWQRTLGGDKDDHLYCLSLTNDDGILMGGSSTSGIGVIKSKSNSKGADLWLLKLLQDGQVDWQETYDMGELDVMTGITNNKDGSFLIGGYSHPKASSKKKGVLGASNKKGTDDYVAIKIDSIGQELWRKVVGSSGTDVLRELVQTRDGGYLLVGTSDGLPSRDKNSGKGLEDFWVVKLKDRDKEDPERGGLEAFPNPTAAFTNIILQHDFEEGTATVYDLNGRQLQHFALKSRTVPVNLEGYPVGVYVIKVVTDDRVESVKVIKGERN